MDDEFSGLFLKYRKAIRKVQAAKKQLQVDLNWNRRYFTARELKILNSILNEGS